MKKIMQKKRLPSEDGDLFYVVYEDGSRDLILYEKGTKKHLEVIELMPIEPVKA